MKDHHDTLLPGIRRLLCATNTGSRVAYPQALARRKDRLSLTANIGSLAIPTEALTRSMPTDVLV